MSTRPSRPSEPEDTTLGAWLRVRMPLFLAIPDLLVLYGGVVLGFKIRLGAWMLPHATEWAASSHLALGLHAAALVASGVYTMSPRLMRLRQFLRVGSWLAGAWVLSIIVSYAVDPAAMAPRSVMAVLGLVALVGVLGLRAIVRRGLEYAYASRTAPKTAARTPELRLHDLVARDPLEIDRQGLRDFLSDRTVLVTGAGGSIGAELTRQLVDLAPFRLALVDVSEHNLYQLESGLRGQQYDGDLDFCIADVRDASIMDGLFSSIHPDVVIHAAAYKHVPLMERHPAEAFRNNTEATVKLLDLCAEHEVDRFVFVSTDKAVNPASVLGATKQLAEWYVRTDAGPTHCSVVRFGNVFGTQGSVVPRFEERLAAGEPLPVTHPDMERFFMSPKEACSLLLQTLLFDTYPTYLFRMGQPVKIEWLATQFIRHWYPHADPERMIEYVGRRPGEKLREELSHSDETMHPTEHPSILGLEGPIPCTRAELNEHLRRLQNATKSTRESREQLRHLLLDTRPNGEPEADASIVDGETRES